MRRVRRGSATQRRIAALFGALRPTLAVALCLALAAAPAWSQPAGPQPGEVTEEGLVSLDFEDADLAAVITAISRMTGENFIYDDRVRGRVTILSPSPIPVDQAYAVFESVLQVKGFTTVRTPGGALKIIPLRDAKESNIDTGEGYRPPQDRDRFVTRLIPLRFIDAESIVNTLKPLVSKDAAMAAYKPTNTVILTESASNIRRIMSILDSIDVETYKEDLAVIRIEYAEASSLASQISEIYGAEVASTGGGAAAGGARATRRARRQQQAAAAASSPGRGRVRIITDDRTNSLIVLAPRTNLEEVRQLVRKLDVPVPGGGRIHVYYLNHANAEELAQTLTSLISGAPRQPAAAGGAGGGQAQALRSRVSGLAEGISVTADPATNALVIQASQEGYNTLATVIEKLDVQRPQVLVEALIMEVDVTDTDELGSASVLQIFGDPEALIQSATDAAAAGAIAGATGGLMPMLGESFLGSIRATPGDSVIQAVIRAEALDSGTNIISAPHILTSDNEQAEIRIGDNIPIISSRVESAAGVETGLSTSVNVERQDVGVTLRVTPQITEGDTLRLEIFQEITQINSGLQQDVGNAEDVGVPLSNRRIENTVVVNDGETVVIGGLVSDNYQDVVTKVPYLGDVPVLGWLFKTVDRTLTKVNLLVFLTPHIIREADDLERETIRKREEFADSADRQLGLSEQERQRIAEARREAEARGEEYEDMHTRNPVRNRLLDIEARYPAERLRQIEEKQRLAAEQAAARRISGEPLYYLQAAVMNDQDKAVSMLSELIDSGWEGTLVSSDVGGVTTFEVRVGPFDQLKDANQASEAISRGYDLRPAVMVVAPETP